MKSEGSLFSWKQHRNCGEWFIWFTEEAVFRMPETGRGKEKRLRNSADKLKEKHPEEIRIHQKGCED